MIFTIAGFSVAVDTLLNNRYAISDTSVEPIGEGGMAVIYPGTDTETDQEIAAKTLLPTYQGDSNRRARFRREAEVLQAVQHPHVVELVDVVDDRHGTWILMERLEGENLRDKLDAEGAFDVKTVNTWLAQTCAALENMHVRGYVHLDVTPQNLFLTDDGDVKLIDFGIAQKAFITPKREGNKLLGTADYISPEHGAGRVVTPLSDVYSLGCVVFELVTGMKVFSEHGQLTSDAKITMRQNNVPELPSSVVPELNLPLWLDKVIANALLLNPEERYPSVTAFAEAFNAHANPPLFGFAWPNRKKQEIPRNQPTRTVGVPLVAEPERTPDTRRSKEPSRLGLWIRKELRNARRALVVFALMLAIIFAAPMLGGSAAFDWLLGSVPGSGTEIVDGDWHLRAGPTTDSEIRTLMRNGESVRVTGTPTVNNGQLWWPVRIEVDNQQLDGWAHDDGLQRTWLMDRAAGFEMLQETWSNRWDTVTDALPG